MTEEEQIDRNMAEIAELAKIKKHALGKDMTGGKRLTLVASQGVLGHLHRCADRAIPLTGPSRLTPAPAVSAKPDPAPAPEPSPSTQQPAPRAEGSVPPPLVAFKGVIPAGYYATPSPRGGDIVDFWRIDVPKKGRWEGYSFATRVLGGGVGDEMRTVELNNIRQRLALTAIRTLGIDEAQMLFAASLGRCSDCGRWLTDEESKAAGKGPVCRNKKR